MEEAQIVSPAEAESAPAETVPADAEAAGRREAFESLIRGEFHYAHDADSSQRVSANWPSRRLQPWSWR